MIAKKLLLIAFIIAALLAALWFNGFLKRKLNPYQSPKNGLLFLLLHLLAIFALVFAIGWVIIYYRAFFFKP